MGIIRKLQRQLLHPHWVNFLSWLQASEVDIYKQTRLLSTHRSLTQLRLPEKEMCINIVTVGTESCKVQSFHLINYDGNGKSTTINLIVPQVHNHMDICQYSWPTAYACLTFIW